TLKPFSIERTGLLPVSENALRFQQRFTFLFGRVTHLFLKRRVATIRDSHLEGGLLAKRLAGQLLDLVTVDFVCHDRPFERSGDYQPGHGRPNRRPSPSLPERKSISNSRLPFGNPLSEFGRRVFTHKSPLPCCSGSFQLT